jgi:peptide chain release factor 2
LFEKELAKQEVQTFLGGKYDSANAILTIIPGAGGQDSQDWAAMLSRMYIRYAEQKKWKVSIVHESFGEPGAEGRMGIKQQILEVQGMFAYGYLKGESGVHRLVRISPFSAKSLRHTSFASVEVLPGIEFSQEEIEIKPEDIHVDVFRASGPGGQNVNKRETAVRITHIPSGIVIACQSQRSQQQNKEKALDILAAKLYQQKERKQAEELAALQGKKQAIEWGSQIRSYVLHPYQMVKDHRTQVETSDTQGVLQGDLDEFVQATLKHGNDSL